MRMRVGIVSTWRARGLVSERRGRRLTDRRGALCCLVFVAAMLAFRDWPERRARRAPRAASSLRMPAAKAAGRVAVRPVAAPSAAAPVRRRAAPRAPAPPPAPRRRRAAAPAAPRRRERARAPQSPAAPCRRAGARRPGAGAAAPARRAGAGRARARGPVGRAPAGPAQRVVETARRTSCATTAPPLPPVVQQPVEHRARHRCSRSAGVGDGVTAPAPAVALARDGDAVVRPAAPWTAACTAARSTSGARGRARGAGARRDGCPATVPAYPMPDWVWAPAVLDDAARWLRRFHDATLDFERAGRVWMLPVREPAEVICHNDFAPYNLVFQRRPARRRDRLRGRRARPARLGSRVPRLPARAARRARQPRPPGRATTPRRGSRACAPPTAAPTRTRSARLDPAAARAAGRDRARPTHARRCTAPTRPSSERQRQAGSRAARGSAPRNSAASAP